MRSEISSAVLAGAMLAIAGTAHAQTWPTRTITTVIPFSAGNANDIVGRIVLEQVQNNWAKRLSSRTGRERAARPASARWRNRLPTVTILVHSSSFSAAHVIYKSLPYDTLGDFAAVAAVGIQPTVLITAPSKASRRRLS
jgi:tripartite-type tricarboxylate transporter receptor subunit TctC